MSTSSEQPDPRERGVAAPAPVDVRDQILALWRHRVLILVLAVVLAVAAGVFSVVRTRQFEATATVAVSAWRLTEATPGRLPAEIFVPLMTTPSVAAKALDELKMPGLTAGALLGNIVAVRSLTEASLIRVVARMTSPDDAARVANVFARHAVAAATDATRLDVDDVEAELKTMLDNATERLRKTEEAYDAFRKTARLEMLQREVDTLVFHRGELLEVSVELESERARLARLEADLGQRQQVTSLKQSVTDDPALTEAARGAGTASTELLGLQVTRESVNPVYESLDEEAAKTRARVASLDQQRRQLAGTAGLNGSQLSRLTQLYEAQSTLERLEGERELARTTYEAVAEKYQGARLAAVGRTPQLLIVDQALPPEAPLGRYAARNVLLGLVAGALLGCVLVMLRQVFA